MLIATDARRVALLCGLSLLIWGAGFGVYFLKDDLSMAMFTRPDSSLDARAFTDQLLWPTARTWDDIWRPVPALSWGADYLLFGADPVAFHLASILGHTLNAVLLYWLLRRLLPPASGLAALCGALCFSFWPLFPEAVLWSTQRTVIFGTGFSLAALLAFDVWLASQRRAHFWLAAALSVCGLLSREHALSVTPLMGLLVLLRGGFNLRAFRAAFLLGLISVATYFLLRHAIFGRFSGGYSGWESMSAYAADNSVFADLPRTLRLLFAPVSSEWDDTKLGLAATIAFALAWPLSLCRLVRGTEGATRWRRLALLSTAWLLLSWAPVLYVFEIYPNLLNGRSAYHLMALPLGFLGAGLVGTARSAPVSRMAVAMLLLMAACLLGLQMRNFIRAGDQVRGLQASVLSAAPAGKNTVVVDVPTEWNGAPGVDAYLPWLVAPPYTQRAVPCVALVRGLSAGWWDALAKAPQGSDSVWLRALDAAPWTAPLFPERVQGSGNPTALTAPADQSVLRNRGAESPLLKLRIPDGTHSMAVQVSIPGREFTIPLARDQLSAAADGAFAISLTGLLRPFPQLAQWPLPAATFAGANPLPVQLRLAANDAQGNALGISASHRLLLADF